MVMEVEAKVAGLMIISTITSSPSKITHQNSSNPNKSNIRKVVVKGGLAGALSQLHLGEPKSTEQEVYEEHMRRQCWESGNIDYMGRDSFENIWRRITQTVSAGPSPVADSAQSPAASTTPLRAISPAPPRRSRSSKSRSRSTTPKRDPRDRSPTPQPEDIVPVEKKEGN
ncbi:hypothetical protein RP20_CCG014367 [Aedes albopictus]|nr:hypothetical protein RP20_CCG014367 [Aedes albopictus]